MRWGSNSKPTYKVANVDTNPETWLILTINQSNNEGLSKDITLAFKVTDGENITDYTGHLYPRPFIMSSINATLEFDDGNIINNIINPINVVKNATSYYIEAKIDNQTVNLTSNITHNVTSYGKIIRRKKDLKNKKTKDTKSRNKEDLYKKIKDALNSIPDTNEMLL